jgi:transposase
MGQAARKAPSSRDQTMECPMSQPNDLSRSLAALEPDGTLIAVIEMSQASWLVAGIVPGIERHPLKKLEPDEETLLRLLQRWRDEAVRAGRTVRRIAVAFEAGRDGFWLARWLLARGVEAHVIHPTSVAVSRDHRRAKTDRLDTELLKRAFLGWLRGERDHCRMAAVPTLEAEDARRPNRERESLVGERTRIVNRMKSTLARLGIRGFKPASRKAPELLAALATPEGVPLPPNTRAELRRDMARLRFILAQIGEIETTRLQRLDQAPQERSHAMVRLLARVIGVGIETADMLVHEVLARDLRDRRAVARYAGLTGAPDESGSRRREKGLAKAGNARVRRGMIQLAWRFLLFQKDSALARWYRTRTTDARSGTRKTLIVAMARKLLIALWRLVTTGDVPEGVALRPAG